jgi:hypothetical protein
LRRVSCKTAIAAVHRHCIHLITADHCRSIRWRWSVFGPFDAIKWQEHCAGAAGVSPHVRAP